MSKQWRSKTRWIIRFKSRTVKSKFTRRHDDWSCAPDTFSLTLVREPIRERIKLQQYITRIFEILCYIWCTIQFTNAIVKGCKSFPHSNGYRQDIPFMSYDIPGTLQEYSAGYPIGRKCQYPWDVHSTSSDILWISCLYPIRDVSEDIPAGKIWYVLIENIVDPSKSVFCP